MLTDDELTTYRQWAMEGSEFTPGEALSLLAHIEALAAALAAERALADELARLWRRIKADALASGGDPALVRTQDWADLVMALTRLSDARQASG